jgi:SH3-like domain-containing protein
MLLGSPRTRHLLRVVPLLLALLLCFGPGRQPAMAHEGDRTYRVVYVDPDDVLNIRSGPSVGYAIVGRIPPGGRGVRLVGHCQGWCPVSYNGASGWVNPVYLAPDTAGASLAKRQISEDDEEEDAVAPRARGYVAVGPPAARSGARLPSYWQVTGVAEGESLKVHDAPSPSASVVHAFEPQTGCIKLAGGCQKPWCQVKFPGLSGDRVGWVDSKHLAPSGTSCSN